MNEFEIGSKFAIYSFFFCVSSHLSDFKWISHNLSYFLKKIEWIWKGKKLVQTFYRLALMNQSRMIAMASFIAIPHIDRAHSAIEEKKTFVSDQVWRNQCVNWRIEWGCHFTNRLKLSWIWICQAECFPGCRSTRILMRRLWSTSYWDYRLWIPRRWYCDIQRTWNGAVRPARDWFCNHFRIFEMRPVETTGIRAIDSPRSINTRRFHLEKQNAISYTRIFQATQLTDRIFYALKTSKTKQIYTSFYFILCFFLVVFYFFRKS